ncbi:MAG: nuclear transport factor 2 family protein [Ignavibacteriaceae bacterium]|nr:nuclear transport factor 2 family protein [Ignavibacteriaceae bacterium]
MNKTALQIVQSFQMLLGNGTTDWTKLISNDITFTGPVAQVSGKEKFIELNNGFFPMVRGYEPLNSFESGKYVCLEGKYKVSTPKGNEIEFQMGEVYTVDKGHIKSIRVYYDAEEFRKEFGI